MKVIGLIEKKATKPEKVEEPKKETSIKNQYNKSSLNNQSKTAYQNFDYKVLNNGYVANNVEIKGNLLIVNGLELNFDKNLIEQFEKIHDVIVYMIYCEWKRLFMKRKKKKKCENINRLIESLKYGL